MKLLHILCTSVINCLLRHYSPTVLLTTVLVFHWENWLCWKCVINYEVRSAIVWDFTQRGMAILANNVLLEPVPVAVRSKA